MKDDEAKVWLDTEFLPGGVTNPAFYFYTTCKGKLDKCEPQYIIRKAGQGKELCMISGKVKTMPGKAPEWVKFRASK